MGNRDEELIMLIKQIRKGHGDKREFCNSIYKEVYGLVYPLYRNKSESVSVSKKILIEICKKLDDIDVNKNVHRQIATMTSAYLLEEAVSKHEEELKKHTNLKEYEFSRIKEDDEFLQIMREKAVAFRSARDFEEADDNIKSLTDIQLAILELYAYEMRSVDEIEDLTDIDSTFVASWIADTKDIVVGGPIVSKDILEEASLADLDEEDEDETSQDEDSDAETDAEADEESLREADELDLDDERENRRAAASRSGKVHRGKGKRSNTARIGNFIIHENPATLLLKKIFPVLTLPMRMMVLWIAGGVVLITLIAVIITSVVMGGKSDKKSNKPETSTQAVTTQAETNPSSTEKSNSTTAASKDDNKATEATTKKTNNTNNNSNNNNNNNGNNNNNNNAEETSEESENEDESSSDDVTESSDSSAETTTAAASEQETTTTAVNEQETTTTAAAQETTTAATATTEASSQETTTAASPATP